jgi:hypothetical protein
MTWTFTVQVTNVVVGVLRDDGAGLGVGEVLDALVGPEVILDPELLAGRVVPQEGVGAEAVHVAPGRRGAAVGHQEGDLVGALR